MYTPSLTKHTEHIECFSHRERERKGDLRTDHDQTRFHCVSIKATIDNTNVMPCGTKKRGPISLESWLLG